jgi:hypothetical protein
MFRRNGQTWTPTRPRPRRGISARRARTLRLVGFRYSPGRDAYVLRMVGNRFGPVYQVRSEAQLRAQVRSHTERVP